MDAADAASADRAGTADATTAVPPAPATFLAEDITGIVAQVMRIPPARLARRRTLNRIGLDSLMANEASARIRRELGVRVPLITLLRGATLDDVIAAARGDSPAVSPEDGPHRL